MTDKTDKQILKTLLNKRKNHSYGAVAVKCLFSIYGRILLSHYYCKFSDILRTHPVDTWSQILDPTLSLKRRPSIVLGLAEQAQVPQGCKFVHDNLITSRSRLDEMIKRIWELWSAAREPSVWCSCDSFINFFDATLGNIWDSYPRRDAACPLEG